MGNKTWLKMVAVFMALTLVAGGILACNSGDETRPEVKIVMAPYFGSWLSTYGIVEGKVSSPDVKVVVDQSLRFDDQMMAGNYPIGAMNTAAFAIAVDRGITPLKALGVYLAHTGIYDTNGVAVVYTRAGSALTDPANLAGKKVGIPGMQSGVTTTFLGMLEEHYGITESQLTLVDNSPPQLVEFLRRGDIDAAVLLGDPAVLTFYDADFAMLWNLDQAFEQAYGTYNPASFLVVQSSYLEENPELVDAVYDLLVKSSQYGQDNLAQLADIYVAKFGGRADFYQNAYLNHYSVTFSPVEGALADNVMRIFEFVRNRGIIDSLPNPADIFVRW